MAVEPALNLWGQSRAWTWAYAAFVDPDGSHLSYAELDVRSDEVAAGLRAEGVGPGDVVLLRLPSDSTYVIAYAADLVANKVMAPRLSATAWKYRFCAITIM